MFTRVNCVENVHNLREKFSEKFSLHFLEFFAHDVINNNPTVHVHDVSVPDARRRPPPLYPKAGNIRKRSYVNVNVNVPLNQEAGFSERDVRDVRDVLAGQGGPWQISAMALLGMLGLLLALFLHLISESNTNSHSHHNHNQAKTYPTARKVLFATLKKKKKTDEWSEDEEVSCSNDDRDRDRNQPPPHVQPPQVHHDMYYPYQPRYHQQQQHRHRKSSATGYKEVFPSSPIDSRPYYRNYNSSTTSTTAFPDEPHNSSHHAAAKAPQMTYAAPSSHHRRSTGRQSPPTSQTSQQTQKCPPPGLGASALKGFVTTPTKASSKIVLGKPLTPVSSFASLNASDKETSQEDPIDSNDLFTDGGELRDDAFALPPKASFSTAAVAAAAAAAVASAPSKNENFVSSSLDYGSDDFATPKAGANRPVKGLKISARELPFMPNLDQRNLLAPTAEVPPPLSHEDEEAVNLFKMESGHGFEFDDPGTDSTTSWLKDDMEDSSIHQKAYPGHPNPLRAPQNGNKTNPQAEKKRHEPKRHEALTTPSSNNNARNSIIHKRKDLTLSTDATASLLSSSIHFEELQLGDVIGGGGFGQVWKAHWRGTPVAVKILAGSAQTTLQEKILEEFAAEINMLKGMRHPNICLYMGACFEPPNRAIITELASNGSLWDALRLPLSAPYKACDGFSQDSWPPELYKNSYRPGIPPAKTWPWQLVKRVACGAARGMTYLHSGNPPVLHRDLKSANLLLDDSYTTKVCDFGLSRLKEQEKSMTGNCGTVQWMAPEVLANKRYAEPADIYSFGIILWELLTRECPYEGMNAIQCALAVLNRNHRPDIPKWCPLALKALIESCIQRDPAKRPTFAQILLVLDAMP